MRTSRIYPKHCRKGFSLIELLVVMAIIAIILGFTTASYRDFQTNQELNQDGKTLVTNLRFAQSQAFAGVEPSPCTTTLIGWYVRVENGGTQYTVHYRCGDGSKGESRTTAQAKDPVSLVQGISISVSQTFNILFQPLNRDAVFISDTAVTGQDPPFTSLSGEIPITLTKQGKSYTVRVRKTGDIQ